MKLILVPTDFSVNAYKALQYAVEISRRSHATIILLNVCQLLESPFVDRQALRAAYNRNLVSHKHRLIDKLLHGCHTERMACHTKIPLLTIPG